MSTARRVLVLVRHAKAARPPATTDHERPLSDAGNRASAALGVQLAAAGLIPDLALVSTSRRTRETWDAVSEVWDTEVGAGVRVVASRALYEASTGDVLGIVRSTAVDEAVVLVCGHEPTISAVVRELAGDDGDPGALAAVAEGMRTGAAAVLHVDPADSPWPQLTRGRLTTVLHPQTQ